MGNKLSSSTKRDEREALKILVRKGERHAANKLLQDYLDHLSNSQPHCADPQCLTAVSIIDMPCGNLMHYSCIYGWKDIVLKLVDSGSDINATDKRGDSSLNLACLWNHEDLAMTLLERGAKVGIKNCDGNTAIYGACRRGMINVVRKILLSNDFDPNISNNLQQTVLHCIMTCYAEDENNDSQFNILLLLVNLNGIELNAQDYCGNTALHYACQSRHTKASEVVELLISKGANTEILNHRNCYPFMLTYRYPMGLDIMEKLIRLEVPVRPPPSSAGSHHHEVYTILTQAADKNLFVAKILIQKLIPRDACLKGHRTYLHHACDRNDSLVIQLLLEEGFDMYAVDDQGVTPVHEAAGYLKTLNLMIQHCQSMNTKLNASIEDVHRKIPLHRLGERYRNMEESFANILKIHLSHGADINAVDEDGCTALYYACNKNHPAWEIVIWLKHGADQTIANKKGVFPLTLLDDENQTAVKALLQKYANVK